MNITPLLDANIQTEEISSLIGALHEIGQRLEDLTVGEVDTVADSHGRTFLLRHAQEHLLQIKADRQAAILDALAPHIALLDPEGVIVSVNEAWRRFGRDNELQSPSDGMGMNYLKQCDAACDGPALEAPAVAAGLRDVLSGVKKSFSIEYPCHSSTE